jgi:hypothetical protein
MERSHTLHTTDEYIPDPDEDIIENVPNHHNTIVVDDTSHMPVERSVILFRTYQIVWFLLGIIETLLVFRFLLKMIGASQISGFTDFIYAISYPFAAPFIGIVPSSISGPMIIEWSTLVGMLVYLVIAYGILELVQLLTPIHHETSRYTTRRSRYAL